MNRRLMVAGLFVAIGFGILAPAQAFKPKAFDVKAFEAAQMAGKPVLGNDPGFKDLIEFQIDFDTQKDLLRKFDERMQSTLISFKGTKGRQIDG